MAGGAIAFLLPPMPDKEFPKKINNILIIRPGGIGDAVFLLPILRALKIKDLKVDILCEGRNAEVFTSQPGLTNKVYLYDRHPFAIFANSYDVVIDTEQWHYLSALTAFFVKSFYKIGFATRLKRAKLFHRAVPYDVDDYELDNFRNLFKDILWACDIKGQKGSFNVDDSAQRWAKNEITEKFVTVFLGASIVLRRLNDEQLNGHH